MGNGAGSLSANGTVTCGSAPQAVAIGDANGDGAADVAVANTGAASLSLALGNGAGGFGTVINYVCGGSQPSAIAFADMNQDGRGDVIITNRAADNVCVICNQMTASPPFVPYIVAPSAASLPAAALPAPSLTLKGSGFSLATAAAVGAQSYGPASLVIINDNEIRIVFNPPPLATGAQNVTITSPAGTSSPVAVNITLPAQRVIFTDNPAPSAGSNIIIYAAGPSPGNVPLIGYSLCQSQLPLLPYMTFDIGGCGDLNFTAPTPPFDAAGLVSLGAVVPPTFHGVAYLQFSDINIPDFLNGIFPFPMSNVFTVVVP